MRTSVILFILLVAACRATPAPALADPVPAEPVAAPAPALTDLGVPEIVAVALDRNPDLGMAAARIEAARAAVEAARTAFSPTVGFALSYTHTNDPVFAFMQTLRNRDLSFSSDFNDPGQRGNFRASLEAGWLVYDGGRREAGVDLARMQVELSAEGREAITNALKAAVIDTSLAVFEAEEFIRVADDSVGLVTEQLKIAKSRFDAGAAQRSDVLTVEVRLAAAREELVRARNAKERSLSALRGLAGIRADEPFSLRAGDDFRVPPVEEEDLLAAARSSRPELRRAEAAVRAARRAVELAETGDAATVSAFGSYDLDDQYAGFTFRQDSATAGVRLDVPILNGGRTAAEVAAARARVREAMAGLEKALLAVETDVTRARLDLEEANGRLAVSEKAEELAAEALSLIRARYETGAATITEYLDAEVALTGARVRNITARFDVERATADLRRALGVCRAAPGGTNR